MMVRACLRSGMCCKKSPCGYGEWDKEKKQCAFLGKDNDDQYTCLKHEEISKDPLAIHSPAFGFGCCSPIGNSNREIIKVQKFHGKEQYLEIDDFL
jgi:hypothetical protein